MILSNFLSVCHFRVFTQEMSRTFAHLYMELSVLLLLDFMGSLYMLGINPISGIWSASVTSAYVGCLFILLIVSFAVQKFDVDPLLIFVTCIFDVISKTLLPTPVSKGFFPCFHLGVLCFHVLHFSS